MARAGTRLPSVTLYAEKEEIQDAFQKAHRAYTCYHCGESFHLMASMGALECRQHPGYVQEDGRWSCCGVQQNPVRWASTWSVQRMYHNPKSCNSAAPYSCPKPVRGCQPCDHNTSDVPFQHTDAQSIEELSAILPYMNKKFPFHLRKGFDNGVLRRCDAKRRIHLPQKDGQPIIGSVVTYMDIHGTKQEFTVEKDVMPPFGNELYAVDEYGHAIEIWW